MVCGFGGGYFGMQELADGKKVLLFSVWDAADAKDPGAVEEEKRVKVLQKDEKVRVGRFGGEGTGAQSFFDYDWKPGATYRFLVTAKAEDGRTAYAAYFYVPEDKDWKRLATLSRVAGGKVCTAAILLSRTSAATASRPARPAGPFRQRLGQGERRPVDGADAGAVHGRLEPRQERQRGRGRRPFSAGHRRRHEEHRRGPRGRTGPPAGRRAAAGGRGPPFGEGRRLKPEDVRTKGRRGVAGRTGRRVSSPRGRTGPRTFPRD